MSSAPDPPGPCESWDSHSLLLKSSGLRPSWFCNQSHWLPLPSGYFLSYVIELYFTYHTGHPFTVCHAVDFSLYQKVMQLSRQFQAVFITPERNPIPISHHCHSFSISRPWEPLSYCLSVNLAIPDTSYQWGHLSLYDGFISLHDVFKVHPCNRLFPFLKLNNIPSYSWTTSFLLSSPVFTASCAIQQGHCQE